MSLYARNVAVSAGGERAEVEAVVEQMVAAQSVRHETAVQILAEMRAPR